MVKLKLKLPQKTSKFSGKITADMPIGQIVVEYPDLAQVLTEDYGFHCIGCFASTMETLEQGAEVHGMTELELGEMVKKLNKLVAKT